MRGVAACCRAQCAGSKEGVGMVVKAAEKALSVEAMEWVAK